MIQIFKKEKKGRELTLVGILYTVISELVAQLTKSRYKND